ncbi:lytic transglycosylase [Bowmanella denitrificans]|uniref:lytic transglycosylase n=1 Tax=Bowmanella denitrificans TaxID=366582 RepID=UPI000C9C52AB|nr:LysM peptidoglycan-binding domain-containing protein [Bowmanella denitrificans]
MKKLLFIFPLLGLSACVSTVQTSQSDIQQDKELEIAAQVLQACEEAEHNSESCQVAQEGTIPITHPVEEINHPIETVPELIDHPEEVQQITNLWSRIGSQLSFEVPDDRRVKVQQDWYLKHPAYMDRVSKRAAPFLYLIVEELEKRNMPMELALLPIVESAFDPFAYSHGRAAGMWQFIPGTGKRFGLRQSWWYDGRRDVLASTTAAMDYLLYLNEMFDGNWLHALAAYNSGEGRVARAIKDNKRKGKSTDFWSLDLPRETRAYVPKLLALANILKKADEWDAKWLPIENRQVTGVVDVGSQIDLALAADMAGLSVEELHALNPGYNRWATDPKGPHTLLLPIDKVDSFMIALNDLDESKRLNWVRHQVKSGDSLLKLAKKYHTSVDVIQQVNEVDGNMIRAGDHLLIPVALKSMDYYSLSAEQRLAETQAKPRASYQLSHQVKSGDTLWDLSRKYDVNVRSLAKWNGMAPTDPLIPGKKLVIWVNKVSSTQSDNAIMRTVTYTVRNGDSLARIAGKFKVAIDDLARWNQLNANKYLQPGQKLKVHVDVTRI